MNAHTVSGFSTPPVNASGGYICACDWQELELIDPSLFFVPNELLGEISWSRYACVVHAGLQKMALKPCSQTAANFSLIPQQLVKAPVIPIRDSDFVQCTSRQLPFRSPLIHPGRSLCQRCMKVRADNNQQQQGGIDFTPKTGVRISSSSLIMHCDHCLQKSCLNRLPWTSVSSTKVTSFKTLQATFWCRMHLSSHADISTSLQKNTGYLKEDSAGQPNIFAVEVGFTKLLT